MPGYQVTERTYSWGTHAKLWRDNRLVMFVDLFRDGSYQVYACPVT